jgi:hypothetical protein
MARTHGTRINPSWAGFVMTRRPSADACDVFILKPVFRIHDILVWIRILISGSMPPTNGSGSGSECDPDPLFSSLTFKMPAKN